MEVMEATFNRISKILRWYYEISKDFSDIDTLIYERKQLSIESVKLAQIVGDFRSEFDSTYFKRKNAFAKSFLDIKSNTEKVSDAVATAKANIEIEEINDIEKNLEGNFNKGKMILGQVNQVLASMQQHLSYLKKEKESVTVREKT